MLTALIVTAVLSTPQGAFFTGTDPQNAAQSVPNGQYFSEVSGASSCSDSGCLQTCDLSAGPYCTVTGAMCMSDGNCACTWFCASTNPGGQRRPGDGIPRLAPKADL